MVFNFRGQLQCRMGDGKLEGPIEAYPKFWNLNALAADKHEILRIPAWMGSFDLVKRELETILEREVLPTVVPEFPMDRRMTQLWSLPYTRELWLRSNKGCSQTVGTPCS